ncbi:type II secretion system GspH family protein [Candidatus Parcubacteria bacterium]|nr:type II secretion system GspH family protein [Candidatus Parcubacteria bacterium]
MLKQLLNKERGNSKGFTLIEIVLVLAIAGLILLIVFLAVQGAQRSRRDGQRKNDAARILSQAEQFASNNNGRYPTAWTDTSFQTAYVAPLNITPPGGGVYTYAGGYPAACPAPNTVYMRPLGRGVQVKMCLETAFQELTNS